MEITRREFVAGACAMPALGAAGAAHALLDPGSGIRLGICDWCCGVGGIAALDVAKRIGLEGIQISPSGAEDRLSYADPAVQAQYRAKAKETGIAIAGLALTVSNEYPLASDPRAGAWLEQTIDATHDLGCKAILLAFFSKGDLTNGQQLKTAEIDSVIARLKEAAPRAERKRVVLGIESYLPAAELIRIMDRVGSRSVGVYYDIANTTARGYDVPAEIRQLKGRICQFHFKDYKGELGTSVEFPAICYAIRSIGYRGWIIFENQSGPDLVSYFRHNAELTRTAFHLPAPAR